MEVCRIDGDLGRGEGWGVERGPLGLYFAGALDEGADEGFGVTVDGGYDGWWDGLGDCLVDDLDAVEAVSEEDWHVLGKRY